MIGLVEPKELSPGDLVVSPHSLVSVGVCVCVFMASVLSQGVNKDSYLILDKLPAE